MQIIIAIIIFLASINLSHAVCSWSGNTGTASALTTAEIQTCIDDAAVKTGDVTINLPAGTATITGTLTVNMTASWPHLSIIGAGTIPSGTTRGSAGSTIINRGTTTNTFLNLTGTSTKKFRFANVRITGTASSGSNGIFVITGTSRPATGGGWRIDHCDLGTDAAPVRTRVLYVNAARTYGVMDHNLGYTAYQMAYIGEPLGGNASWNRAISVGTNEAVYFEDNTFYQKDTSKNWFFADGIDGARIVVRYNNMYGYHIGAHDASSNGRGIFQYEAYNNVIDFYLTKEIDGSYSPHFFLRGGTQIIYNNDLRNTGNGGSWETGILLMNYRSRATLSGHTSPWTDVCNSTQVRICAGPLTSTKWEGWSAANICDSDSDCGGTSGSCQNIDGNTNGTGWPCRDQIGVTSDGTISGQFTRYPSLYWNNDYCAGLIGCTGTYYTPVVRSDSSTTTHIQNNRDYCHHSTTMPASCNSIATTYTAYTYPHPLTGGGGDEDTTAPILSAWFPTTEQGCAADPQAVNIGITSTDANITTCKWDTSTAAYASLSNTFDGAAAGTVNHTDSASFACGATHTIYYSCQDAIGNTTTTSSWTFSLPALADSTTPVITNVTSSKQAVAIQQKLSVTTSVAGSCRYCVNGVDGCASDTVWASRTAFSVTGGELTHHEVAITQEASTATTYNVICQNTQGTATSTNSAITITTDAVKSISTGGSLSITQGTGSLSVTIIP